jgi:transposase-like protein
MVDTQKILQVKRADEVSMTKNRRTHDKALKQEADRLVVEESRETADVVRNLGIGKGIAIRRVREFKENPIESFLNRILISRTALI